MLGYSQMSLPGQKQNRPVEPTELKTAIEFLEAESDRPEAYRSLLWSLLVTNEFLFNR